MRLPKQVNILGQTYKLKLDKELAAEGLEGYVEMPTYTIQIDASLKENEQYLLRTVWHEIAHAYAMESGLHEFLQPQAREMFCQTISALVIQLTGGKLK